MPFIAAPLSAADSRPLWPTTYRPVWKLLAISVVVGIAGVVVTIAEATQHGSDHAGRDFLLLVIALALWGTAVTGLAVRKGSSWRASLIAGLVAAFTAFAVWVLVLFVLLVVALATLGAD